MVFKSPFAPVRPDPKYKNLVSLFFWHQLDKFNSNCLFVDHQTDRRWSGAQIKSAAARVAAQLLAWNLRPNDICVSLHEHCDFAHLIALGCLFAGTPLAAATPTDPKPEHAHVLDLLRPKVVFAERRLVAELKEIQSELALECKIVLLDGSPADFGPNIFGLHAHLLESKAEPLGWPVELEATAPAYILFTSGSTGRPKPVNKSQANFLYAAHCWLESGAELWPMDQSSVLAGTQQLWHGTGLYTLLITLTKGLKLIVINGYQRELFLEAIERHRVTDCYLGTAYLHQFMLEALERIDERRALLGCLRNMIPVGAPLPSCQVADQFMAALDFNCSVRKIFGMAETLAIAHVPRAESLAAARARSSGANLDHTLPVGRLLPNVQVKLLEVDATNDDKPTEINEPNRPGIMWVCSPTVSPNYVGPQFAELSRQVFPARPLLEIAAEPPTDLSYYYNSKDICSFTSDGQLQIHGRSHDLLMLANGKKMLPMELELLLASHPKVGEAAVVGVAHPELESYEVARAFVVCRPGCRVDARELMEFLKDKVAAAKLPIGGIRVLDELPRISVGKVDKRKLKQMDAE